MDFPTWGALLALAVSIILIIRNVPPFYALMFGALFGGFACSFDTPKVVEEMIKGAQDISSAILRVLAAGVLAGALIKSGAAVRIALTIVEKCGEKKTVLAMILAAFLLTACGVFIDVAVLTVAPIALAVIGKSGISKMSMLLALIGGGKCGNILSPNPNTIAAAANYNAELTSVMYANIPAALVGIVATFFIVKIFAFKDSPDEQNEIEKANDENLPSFIASIAGPICAISLLMLRPVCGLKIDPIIALPLGGFVCALCTKQVSGFFSFAKFGLEKMTGVAILLIGTGCLAGIIKASNLKNSILDFLGWMGVGDLFVAPVSGALMSAATASTTAGAAVASATFSQAVIAAGISGVWGAAMTNAGATVLDHLPHGSFFHVTGGSVGMAFSRRLKLMPFESLIGGTLAFVSTLSCYIAGAL